jgi:hypothetical protein
VKWRPAAAAATLLGAAIVACAACAGSAPFASESPTPTDVLEQGYMGHGSTFVMFAQFDSTGATVSGTLTQASISTADSSGVATATFSFTGTHRGQVVVLDVPAATGGQWTATIDGTTLRLRYVDSTGLPAIATLNASSLDAFDSSVVQERSALAGSAFGSCTVGYPNHNATVTIWGTFAGGDASQACSAAVKVGYVSVAPDTREGVVCIVGDWGISALIVRDTGGQVIGGQICKWVEADRGPAPTFTSTPATYY